jgi:DNA-directed RNA polymerase alpha subunit
MMIIIPEDVLLIAEALNAPIDELGLSVRSYNGLRRWGITTVADVYRAYQDKQLPRIRNLGEKSVIEIEKHLEEHLAKVAHVNTSELRTVPKRSAERRHLRRSKRTWHRLTTL